MKAILTLAPLALVAASFASIHPPARATTLKRMSVADLSRAAYTVVRAHCITNSTRWDAGEIWTFTTFDVEEIWKGSAPAQITVRLLGGNAGNFTSTVSGVPRFSQGEELILFLERTPAQDFSIVSWMQGTFRIGRSHTTGEEIVTQDTAAFPVFDPASHNFETEGIRKMPLNAFRSLVMASADVHAQAAQGSRQ
ncbi:MAG: hypothetical protein WB723_19460 [Candidatus Acidiferrales bacterium]